MTENKLFKIVNDCGDYHLMNGDEILGYDLCSPAMREENWNNVVNKLNEQEEEISNLQLIIGVNGKAYRKSVKEYEEFIEELEQENEQLKKEKKELQCQCNLLREQKNEFHRIALENANRVGQLEKENEQLKKENKHLRCTIESNSQDDYIDYLEKQNERLKERITELASNDKIVFMNGQY